MPAHTLHPGKSAGDGTAGALGVERFVSATQEDGDVFAGQGVDAFEGPADGVEAPEVAGHGGGAAVPGFPGADSEAVPCPACEHNPARKWELACPEQNPSKWKIGKGFSCAMPVR